jgi:hypothetical protein
MAYENIYQPTTDLLYTPPKAGGLCSINAFRWEDVLVWPSVDPQTGVLVDSIQLKPGASFLVISSTEKDRVLKEVMKVGAEGPYMEISVTCKLAGNSAGNTLSLDAAKFSRWGLIVKDRNGDQRLVGNEDGGAKISFDYTTGDIDSSRMRTIVFTWEHQNSAPIYTAAAFSITIGGQTVSVGTLVFIARFRVDDPGAAMTSTDTTYTNALLANKKALVLADGTALPVDDGSGSITWTGLLNRHIQKTNASTTITFVGGVNTQEIIEIYAFT